MGTTHTIDIKASVTYIEDKKCIHYGIDKIQFADSYFEIKGHHYKEYVSYTKITQILIDDKTAQIYYISRTKHDMCVSIMTTPDVRDDRLIYHLNRIKHEFVDRTIINSHK